MNIPMNTGSRASTRFCAISLPTGMSMLPPSTPGNSIAATPITSGIVNNVSMLLHAVRDTLSATSPLASIENTLDELPPGQHAMSIRPR